MILAIKIITTVMIAVFSACLVFFMRGLKMPENKFSIVGFSAMLVTYVLSLVCIWGSWTW